MAKINYYTIGDLKRDIANLPDDMPIVHQRDPEGNGYAPLDGIEETLYDPKECQTYTEHDFEYLQTSEDWSDKDIQRLLKVAVVWPTR